jgi:hypothetical protein
MRSGCYSFMLRMAPRSASRARILRGGKGELELLTPSFWQPRCLEQREYLRNRFSVLARTDDRGGLREMV